MDSETDPVVRDLRERLRSMAGDVEVTPGEIDQLRSKIFGEPKEECQLHDADDR